jgi:hypothetical protein
MFTCEPQSAPPPPPLPPSSSSFIASFPLNSRLSLPPPPSRAHHHSPPPPRRFDEPSSYLDVKQRIHASKAIRSLLKQDNYVIVVEHDLAVLDYLSDFICVLYGQPGRNRKLKTALLGQPGSAS